MGKLSRFIFVGNEIIHTKKAQCLYEMNKQKLNIPFTVVITDIRRISEITKYFEEVSSVFCRVNYSDTTYPHYESKICSVNNLKEEIEIILGNLNSRSIYHYDIIVQQMLNISWSGVVLSKDGVSLIEVVNGNLAHLLRDGIFHSRFFIDKKGDILKEEKGTQTQYRDLINNQLVLKEIIKPKFNIELLLEKVSSLSAENTLYEFGLHDNTLFFLDSKKVHEHSYPSLSATRFCDTPFIIWQDDKFNFNEVVAIERPVFEDIADILKDKTYLLRNGSYLSHFATYLASNNINSSISS